MKLSLRRTCSSSARSSPSALMAAMATDSSGYWTSRTGVSVVAVSRGGEVKSNPKPQTVLLEGDAIGIIGDDKQVDAAKRILKGLPDVETVKPGNPIMN